MAKDLDQILKINPEWAKPLEDLPGIAEYRARIAAKFGERFVSGEGLYSGRDTPADFKKVRVVDGEGNEIYSWGNPSRSYSESQ